MSETPPPAAAEPLPPLEQMLVDVATVVDGREKVLFGELLDALGRRGFGPVLTLASAMTILPTGVVPMVPAFMGAIMLLASVQMLRGRKEIRVPPRVYRLQLPGATVLRALERAAPAAHRLGKLIRPHLVWLTRGWLAVRAIALVTIATSLAIIAIGAIPGLPFVLAIHLLAFGIGLTAGDGRFVAAGFAIFLPAAYGAAKWAGLL
ncbi:exopolysaccharide biosynthesis protein [Tropicimonas marinistellae]|uniref:exopolysaccharide biosynthesis protein n=1 Tax=Tropicimonas marinistellae TaxID=1739787 RepID=UPI00082FFC76|nr:exopolysaccharide biosynthesis protein [Tropicimonas marinistellae]